MYYRCHAARRGGGIHHQQHRYAEQLSDLGAAALLAPAVHSIEQSHHAFYNRHLGSLTCVSKNLLIALRRKQPCIEVVRRPTANVCMMSRVKEIRATFKWLHRQAPLT